MDYYFIAFQLVLEEQWLDFKEVFFSSVVETTLSTPTSDSGVDTIRALSADAINPSPTLHYFTYEQLRSVQSMTNQLADLSSSPISSQNGTYVNLNAINTDVNIMDLANAGKFDELAGYMWTNPTIVDLVSSNLQNFS